MCMIAYTPASIAPEIGFKPRTAPEAPTLTLTRKNALRPSGEALTPPLAPYQAMERHRALEPRSYSGSSTIIVLGIPTARANVPCPNLIPCGDLMAFEHLASEICQASDHGVFESNSFNL